MTVQKKILDLTGTQYLVQKITGEIPVKISDLQDDASLGTHIADTDIHVTTTDKNRWNNNTYVFRYSSTALTASSTNSNALLDNTDNLKVGDKVIDSSGVLFSITAIDTQNSTFTIGTALIDLAQDSNVVHKTGDETIAGVKTFLSTMRLTAYPSIRMYLSDDEWNIQPATTKQSEIRFTDKYAVTISYFIFQHKASSTEPFRTCWRQQKMDGTNAYYSINFNNSGIFYPENNNAIDLGGSGNRWKSVYATNYYYGSNNVEFSTKFVTTDTAQTISGTKTFSSNITCSNNSGARSIICKTPLSTYDSTNTVGDNARLEFLDKNNKSISYIRQRKLINGNTDISLNISNTDSNNQSIEATLNFILDSSNEPRLSPGIDNTISLGRPTFRYKSLYGMNYYYGSNNVEFSTKFVTTDTNQTISGSKTFSSINGVEPSSLSLPVFPSSSSSIDISSYITDMTGSVANSYTPPANGYITFVATGSQVQIFSDYGLQSKFSIQSGSTIRGYHPVLKNEVIKIYMIGTSIEFFRFIPCQGNV